MQKRKTSKAFNKTVICFVNIALIIAIFLSSYSLFHFFIYDTEIDNDIRIHVVTATVENGYSLTALIIKFLLAITGTPSSVAAFLSVIVVCTGFCVNYLFSVLFKLYNYTGFSYWRFLPVSMSTIFICSVYIPKIFPHFYYYGITSTQPWHNTTYLMMRMFAVFAVAMYFVIESNYVKKIKFSNAFVFTVALLLANAVKPNFIIGFAPIMLLFMIIDFIKEKGKCLKNSLLFGICVLISLSLLIIQYKILYVDDSESGIIFTLAAAKKYFTTKENIIAVICDLAFPLFTSVALLTKKRDSVQKTIMLKGWLMYLFSFCTYMFLAETGYRKYDGNFAWGMIFFAFLLNIICLSQWISCFKNSQKDDKFVYILGWLVYIASIASGLSYYTIMVTAHTVYIM